MTGEKTIYDLPTQDDCFVFAPNYWQWFNHHLNHTTLPAELSGCTSQLDMINCLGLSIFSRNIYCEPKKRWYGGLAEEVYDSSIDFHAETSFVGNNIEYLKKYSTSKGVLTEKLCYLFNESTLVQDQFLVKEYSRDIQALEKILLARKWKFHADCFDSWQKKVGDSGIVVAGELHSPLKMLHFLLGPIESSYLIMDHPDVTKNLLAIHEAAQLDLVEQMAKAGVKVMMSMDNLDTMFHPPHFIERYSASFYEKASTICHTYGSKFLIHACGRQKSNLKLISSLGVDGLEGVASPPLGDVWLDEAFALTHDAFIITGGISANETDNFQTKEEIFDYIKNLFTKLKPYKHKFILSASCNTATDTPFEKITWFKQAWDEFKSI